MQSTTKKYTLITSLNVLGPVKGGFEVAPAKLFIIDRAISEGPVDLPMVAMEGDTREELIERVVNALELVFDDADKKM